MTSSKRFWLGVIGSLIPIAIDVRNVDMAMVFQQLNWYVALGFCTRSLCNAFLGGITSWAHKNIKEPFYLIELGIIAPALFTAVINGYAAHLNQAMGPYPSTTRVHILKNQLNLIPLAMTTIENSDSTAEIDSALTQPSIKILRPREESGFQDFIRGFFGLSPATGVDWFVIAGDFPSKESAVKKALTINYSHRQFHADVYEWFADGHRYLVIIGADLTYNEAMRMRFAASKLDGLKDVYVWTPVIR